ncbi:uncharacterized protein LOC116143062 [Pistacia vera]|uniref:uncharacterized protein LOC116143062 n=1 Tax=Pistacia vera TaxID=55513 RepID=UPI0012630843|nr:uncharacterized protein LOC116143062 [Pistacia vera]
MESNNSGSFPAAIMAADYNSPLFIHPSDTPGSQIVSQILTGSDNYSTWSRAMKIALLAKNKLGFIDGTIERPTNPLQAQQWDRCNATVMSWIMNSISKDLVARVIYGTSAMTVWQDLQENFDKVNGSRIYSIMQDIATMQ